MLLSRAMRRVPSIAEPLRSRTKVNIPASINRNPNASLQRIELDANATNVIEARVTVRKSGRFTGLIQAR